MWRSQCSVFDSWAYIMGWLTISVLANILLVAVANQHNNSNQIRCTHSTTHTCSKNRNGRFFLDRHEIKIKYDEEKFSLDCNGWNIFDSDALPRFRSEFYTPNVKLIECPLPESRSFVDIFAMLNVHIKNGSSLLISDLPSASLLSASHFTGLEYMIIGLEIKAYNKLTITRDTLANLHVLQSLKLTHVSIEDESNSGNKLNALLTSPVLKKLQLVNWDEKELSPLENCDELAQLDLYKPSVDTLPDRWVAACPKLEKITLKSAEDLISLPSGLLESATALKRLTITRCMSITSLPDGLFQGTPNLMSLDLSHNRFQRFASETFAGTSLRSLSLSFNRLEKEALDAIGQLTSLTKLDLSHNILGNICDANGYSPVQKLTQLKELSFMQTDITHICRDWRENMTLLETLDLRETEINELTYDDIVKYNRDPSLKNAELILDDASITSVHFTEEDFNNARLLTEDLTVKVPLSLDDLTCDCKMYWTRKAIDVASIKHIIPLEDIRCNDGSYLKNKSLDDICPDFEKNLIST